MTSSPSLCLAVFLLASLGASSAWDTSNIWFPDPNNPVFYNMTFYQEAAKAVQRAASTTPPSRDNQRPQAAPSRNNQRPQAQPSRDNQRPQAPPSRNNQRPQAQPPRDNQRPQAPPSMDNQRPQAKPCRDNQRSESQSSRNNQRQPPQPCRNEVRVSATAARPTESGQTKPTWNRMVSRVNPNQQGVRLPAQQGNRNTASFQETPVGFRTGPEEEATQTMDEYNRNMKVNQQPSGNRLERRDQEQPVFRRQSGSGRGRAGNEAANTVEGNIISDIETTSKSSGPSKCVWAIISCCKPTSTEIRYMCFETLGCHGAFWDTNPCSKEMKRAAFEATAAFYNVPTADD